MKKKIFILESKRVAGLLREELLKMIESEEVIVDYSVSQIDFRRHLPRDYDIYFIHIPNTNEESILELKEKQNWSEVYIRTSMGVEFLPPSLRQVVNGPYQLATIYSEGARILKRNEIKLQRESEKTK